MKKLFIKTYGCQMNFYDSDHMSNLLNGHGYETSEDIKEADLVILNTCHISCLLYTSPSPRDCDRSRMPSSA